MKLTRNPFVVGSTLAAFFLSYSGAQAAGIWDGGNEATPTTPGNYDSALNWDDNAIPGTTVNVNVSNGGTILVTTNHTTNDILAATTASSSGTWTQSAGTLTMGGGWFRLGTAAGAGGTFNLNGGALSTRGRINIGEANGTAGGTASVTVAGGAWTNNNTADLQNITVGGELNGTTAGKGTLTLSSGSITNTASMNVAYGTGGQGSLTVTGGTLTETGTITIGRNGGTGIMTVSGGTITNAGQLWVGEGASAAGTVNLSGSGTLNTGSWLAIGRTNGTGTFNMSGGTYNKTTNAGDATIIGASGPGTLNQTGGLFNVSSGATWIGETKAGTWLVSGGTVNLQALNVGQGAAGIGILTLQPNTGATGPLTNGGGAEVVTAAAMLIGNNATATGTVNLDGGTLAVNTIGKTGGTGTLNFNGGKLQARTATATFLGGLTTANVRNGGAVIDSQANNITITQSLTHSVLGGDAATDGGLTKSGTGTLVLSGTNTFTGPITASAGKLQANSTGAFPANTNLAVNGGLDFNGQYGTTAGAGAARTFANLNAGATGELTFKFGATTADNIAITNAATVAPGAKISLSFATGVTLTPGTYTLLSAPGGLDNFTFTGPANLTTGGFFYPLTYSTTPTADTVTVGAGQIAKLFYTGNGGNNLLGNAANYSIDAAGATAATTTPTSITDVVFTATTATTSNFSPTLDTVATANSLQFSAAATTPVVLSGPGTLTISAGSNTFAAGNGIVVDAGSAAHEISANLALGAAQSFTNNSANAFTVSGAISGSSALTVAGTGTKIFSANNPLTGALNIGGGILRFTTIDSLGAGNPVNFTGGTLQFGSGITTDITSTHTVSFNGAGTIDTNGNNVSLAGVLGGTGGGSITKTGSGELTLTGGTGMTANPSNLFVRNGTLTLTGAPEILTLGNYSSVGQASGDRAILNVLGGAKIISPNDFNLGDVGGTSLAAVDGGIVNLSGTGSSISTPGFFVGKGGAAAVFGYGVFNQAANTTFTSSGNSQIGMYGIGQYNQTGGIWNHTGGYISVARFAGSFGVIDLNGGTLNDSASGSRTIIGEVGTAVLNVRNGGLLNNTTAGNASGGNLTTALAALTLGNSTGGAGIVNLLPGGKINTTSVGGLNAGTTGIFNFNGGTLATRSTTATFMQNLTSANVFAGGAVIDTTLGDGTITQPLIAPAGAGVDTITASGTGFSTTPIVQITGGGGTGATAVATVDNTGTLTGVTVTNPGTGYTGVPTVTITGPFGTQVSGTAALNAGNVSGTLNKIGTGTLTLVGSSTYTGDTTVTNGTLQLGNGTTNGTIASANIIDNGTFSINNGAVQALSVPVSGTGGFTKLGAGTLTITSTNSYTGVTTVGGGILSVADIGNGGANSNIGAAPAASSNLVFSGNGSILYTGSSLVTDRGYTMGTGGGGIDHASDVTFTGQILATGNGSFTKNGAGTLSYTNTAGTNALTGGNVGNALGFVANNGLVQLGGTSGSPLAQTNSITGELIIGTINNGSSPNVAVEINGGTTTVTSYVGVGRGNGANNALTSLTLNNSAALTSGNFAIGYDNAVAGYKSSPTVTFNGSSSYTDSGVFTLGESVNAAGGVSTVNVNGTASVSLTSVAANAVSIGLNSAAVLNQNGGTVTAAGVVTIARNAASTSSYHLNGGTLTATGVAKGAGIATFNFNGGVLAAPASSATFLQGLTRANVRDGGAIIHTGVSNVTIAQALVHSDVPLDAATDGGLTKQGAGTLTLTAAGSYTGDTTVSAGTLELQADDSLADLANVKLATGTTLQLNFTGTDTVSRLYLNGVEQAAGIWGRMGSGAAHESAMITSDGLLDVTNGVAPGTPFNTWAAARGLTGGDAAASADPDSDGYNNLAEFILGGEPNPANAGANSNQLAPEVTVAGGNHVFSFRRTQLSTTQPGIVIGYEYGSDLTGWTLAVNGVDGITISAPVVDAYGAGIDRVDVSIPDSLAPVGIRFARLHATIP